MITDKELRLWKKKTRCAFHIIEYMRFWNFITTIYKENKKLKSTIKEVREHIQHTQNYGKEKIIYVNGNDILEILDTKIILFSNNIIR